MLKVGDCVGGSGVGVGSGVGAGAHPFITKTVRKTNKRMIDPIDFFMTLSPFDLIAQDCAQRFALPAGRTGKTPDIDRAKL